MQLHNAPLKPRQRALQIVASETGWVGVLIVVMGAGVGALLDFQIAGLHPLFSVGLLLASIPVSLYWTVRRTLKMGRDPHNESYFRNLALASVAGQSGCSTVIMVFMALFAGLYLDSRLDTHPIFTIGLVVVSVPLSLYVMVRIVMNSVGAINLTSPAGGERSHPDSPAHLAEKSNHTKENGS